MLYLRLLQLKVESSLSTLSDFTSVLFNEASNDTGHLELILDGKQIPLAFVTDSQDVYLMSSGNSRWPSSILRQRKASMIIDGRRIHGQVKLVSENTEKERVRKMFSSKYGVASFSRWFDVNSRVICVEGDENPPEGKGIDSYFEWLKEEFESISGDYDRHIYGNRINSYLRERSVEVMLKLFPPESELLEIGCGTGTETLSMLKAGHSVTAVDISQGMVASLRKKAEKAGLSSQLRTEVMPASECMQLADKYGEDHFDGLYSTYGALNCEPDLARIPNIASRLLRRDSILFLGMFNKLCISEMIAHATGLKLLRMFERMRNPVPEGNSRFCIDVYAYSPMEIRRLFGNYFYPVGIEAVPVIVPPSNYVHYLEKFSPDYEKLEAFDRVLSRLPIFRNLGDHFLIWFRKKST